MASSCGSGSAAMWIVVRDVLSHVQQLANTVISTILFGITTSLFIASVYVISREIVHRRSAILQLTATLVLYISTTTFTSAALHAAFTTENQVQTAASAISECDALAYFSPVSVSEVGDRMNCIQTATLLINILVGDAVVWWRVYMLWPAAKVIARRVILGAAATLLVATFALGVVDTCGACNLSLGFVQAEEGYGLLFSGAIFGAAAASMSLATNAIATCFTAYKAWIHLRSLKAFGRGFTLTEAEQILVLVVESGLIYTAIWIVVVIWQVGLNDENIYQNQTQTQAGGSSFWAVAGYFVNGGLVPIIAMYPMCIIVMVALKRMKKESTWSDSETGRRWGCKGARECVDGEGD
ncbi:hypothetical protein L226DRAFT_369615 [Lentinus tigrinus ALCF2SS1-7]|uniref:uncharacterized protein n=1 Tax=Lentinus tigrinus ALCF2SS1-7 TaxID=1328758 RepID=UPI001165F5B7|nr:hypothetical protein L226DRAFT_369615 [Lentinus tigrinus ALCF2SS1-7]